MAKHKIRNQLLMTLIFLTLIPVMIISIYIINVYSDSIIEVEEQSLARSQAQIQDNMAASIEKGVYMIGFLRKDKQIHDFLHGEVLEEADMPLLLNGYRHQVDYVLSINLWQGNAIYGSSDDSSYLDHTFLSSPIYQEVIHNDGLTLLSNYMPGHSPIISDKSEFIDTVHLMSRVHVGEGESGIIDVMMSSILFEEAVRNVDLGGGGYFYVMNEQHQVVYTPVASNALSKVNQTGYLTNSTPIKGTSWTLHVVKPINQVLSKINLLRNNLIKLFLVTIIILVIIIAIFSNLIVRPIKTLQRLMKKVEKGNLDVQYEETVNNEVHELGMGFNKMIREIKKLISQVKKEQQAKKIAEIGMLQSNIKPHFLYNTLETIRWMTKKYEADDIAETVNALAIFFRVGLSKGKEMIPLEDELTHVASYLKIQKIRYKDILDYQIRVDDSLKSYKVLKLILQPFVENALYHGIKESGEKGMIVISGYLEGEYLYLTVEDDGQGIQEERLAKVVKEFSHYTDKTYVGYGMKNVHQRIQLVHGVDYGVQIKSEWGRGTKVTVRVPKSY